MHGLKVSSTNDILSNALLRCLHRNMKCFKLVGKFAHWLDGLEEKEKETLGTIGHIFEDTNVSISYSTEGYYHAHP